MALEAKRAAVNTAMDAVIAAMKDLYDGLTAGNLEANFVRYVFPQGTAVVNGTPALDPTFPVIPGRQNQYIHRLQRSYATGSVIPIIYALPDLHLGYTPLVWKITNNLGEIA